MRGTARPSAHAHEAPPTAGTQRRGLEELKQLAREGAAPGPLLEDAFRAVFDVSPRLSRRTWGRTLDVATRRGDHYRLTEPTAGAAVEWVIERMQADEAAHWRPHSLAYYVQQLDHSSRQWRRERKPRIKAARLEAQAIRQQHIDLLEGARA
jgi:hypothetical protein